MLTKMMAKAAPNTECDDPLDFVKPTYPMRSTRYSPWADPVLHRPQSTQLGEIRTLKTVGLSLLLEADLPISPQKRALLALDQFSKR